MGTYFNARSGAPPNQGEKLCGRQRRQGTRLEGED
jgi:hypothetical protein